MYQPVYRHRIINMLSRIRETQIAYNYRQTPALIDGKVSTARSLFEAVDRSLSPGASTTSPVYGNPEVTLGEVMTTGDFPYALGEWVRREMQPGYTRQVFGFEPFVEPRTTPGYQKVTRYQNREGVDDLEHVARKGEARPGHISDAVKREYAPVKWEKFYDFEMEALVDDDLDYFQDGFRKMGEAARRTLERFVSRMYTNATSIARLVALGALYSGTSRMSTAALSAAVLAMSQRTDARGERIQAPAVYCVYPTALRHTFWTINASMQTPENANNAMNVMGPSGQVALVGIEDIHMTSTTAWYLFSDHRNNNVTPIILARRQGVPAPMILRKKNDMEVVGSLLGAGTAASPGMGNFASGDIELKVHDEWGTYIDPTNGNLYDTNGVFYSDGTTA